MQLFRKHMVRDDATLKSALSIPQKLHLIVKMREIMSIARKLLQNGDFGTGAVEDQDQTVLDTVTTIKRRDRSALISGDVFLRLERAEKLPEMCNKFRDMIIDINNKRG